MGRVDRFPPSRGIFFVDELGHRNLGEIRIAHEFGAIEKRAPEGLDSVSESTAAERSPILARS